MRFLCSEKQLKAEMNIKWPTIIYLFNVVWMDVNFGLSCYSTVDFHQCLV